MNENDKITRLERKVTELATQLERLRRIPVDTIVPIDGHSGEQRLMKTESEADFVVNIEGVWYKTKLEKI